MRPSEDTGSHGSSKPASSAPSIPRRVLLAKPVAAVATLLLLSSLVEVIPGLERFRVLEPHLHGIRDAPAPPRSAAPVGETEIDRATESRADLAQPEHLDPLARPAGPIAHEQAQTTQTPIADASPVAIVDEARSLDKVFAWLARAEKREPEAVARILFFGDSVVASDFGTATLRRLLGTRFGDSGHGFVLIANPWPQYFHNDVYRVADRGWKVSRIVGPRVADGAYGLGGVSFTGAPGLRSRVGTAKAGDHGRRVSRFEIAYLAQPGGGSLKVSVDGEPTRVVDTEAAEKRSAFVEIRVPDGPHELELLTERANVRLFGVVLERDTPGIVLDAIGVVGARLRTLDEGDDAHFAEQLAWRQPSLIVLQFGANESGDGFAYPMPEYHRTMREVIEKMQRAVPRAGCLVIGAMHRARKDGGRLVTVPIMPLIVEEQRKVAEEVGCAYFSAFEAMGGKGSMAAWVRKGFGAGDFTHPTSWGAEQLGKWLYSALMARYEEYLKRAR